jgi:hypothetical protein
MKNAFERQRSAIKKISEGGPGSGRHPGTGGFTTPQGDFTTRYMRTPDQDRVGGAGERDALRKTARKNAMKKVGGFPPAAGWRSYLAKKTKAVRSKTSHGPKEKNSFNTKSLPPYGTPSWQEQRLAVVAAFKSRENQLKEGGPGSGRRPGPARDFLTKTGTQKFGTDPAPRDFLTKTAPVAKQPSFSKHIADLGKAIRAKKVAAGPKKNSAYYRYLGKGKGWKKIDRKKWVGETPPWEA